MTLQEIADRLECRLEGDGTIEIHAVAGIDHAGPGDLTFVANTKYLGSVSSTAASAVILGDEVSGDGVRAAILRSPHPYLSFARAVGLFTRPSPPPCGIDPTSVIAPDAKMGSDAAIGAFVTIGAGSIIGARVTIYPHVVLGPGVQIGDDCILHSMSSIRERVRIGNRVTVQDGVVIGSDGFGFVKQPDGTHLKIPQHADVVVEDDVEIGANTTIDRPAVGETRIGAGTKIDNLVQIAHGVSVGRRVLFAAQVGIAGSTVVEDDVVLAGQVGIAGHLRIGKGVVATAQSGVPNSVDAGSLISGYPAIPNRDWLKSSAVFRQLPFLKQRVAELEHRIAELEEKLATWQTPLDR